MSQVVEIRNQRERLGRVELYPADVDSAEDLCRGRLHPDARRGSERQLSHIVAMGGGTGLLVVLTGLRRHLAPECRITAVVTVAVDGGGSAVLRGEYGVLEALRTADAVILGPGSLYTSILATLVVPGMVEAVAAARGARVFVCNLMTEPGETDGRGVAGHLAALAAHGLPSHTLDYVVVSTGSVPAKTRARYAAEGAEPVRVDFEHSLGRALVIAGDLLDPGPVARHAADKLGPLLCALAAGRSPRDEV